MGACRGTGPAERHGRPVLRATGAGWVCPVCGYTQDWALAFMAGRSWEQPGGWPLYVLTTAREVDIV